MGSWRQIIMSMKSHGQISRSVFYVEFKDRVIFASLQEDETVDESFQYAVQGEIEVEFYFRFHRVNDRPAMAASAVAAQSIHNSENYLL